MTGIGPRRGSEPDREPRRQAGMDPDAQAAAAGLFHQAYIDGREHERARLTDPQAGYDLGHDVGYAANLDDRAYVHAVMRGFEHGSQARHELAERLLKQSRPQPKPQTQPELEAEAG